MSRILGFVFPLGSRPFDHRQDLLGQPGQVRAVERLDVRVRRGLLHPDGSAGEGTAGPPLCQRRLLLDTGGPTPRQAPQGPGPVILFKASKPLTWFESLLWAYFVGRQNHLRDVVGGALRPPKALSSYCSGLGQSDSQERFRRRSALRPLQSCLRLFPPPSIWHPVADERRGEDIVGPRGCHRCSRGHLSPIARPGEGAV